MGDLHTLPATTMVEKLKHGAVTPTEAVTAAFERIAGVDGKINAMPTLCQDRALAAARTLENNPERHEKHKDNPAWLAGLPVAIKDLVDVAGVRTTYGSPIYRDHVPDASDILVQRLEENGAIVIGKSNTPEFGAGGNTFNEVFPPTTTPWDSIRTSGGSSGGAAAALAAGEVWLATGSDLGGSLRTPASFCGIVGLRPSPGRVASGPSPTPFNTLSVEGPMARTVADTALFLDAMVGRHPVDPMSLATPATPFQRAIRSDCSKLRVAFSPDLGISPVDDAVAKVCQSAVGRLANAGWELIENVPDFSTAMETFQVLRAAGFATGMADLYQDHKDQLKPDIIWNIEKGLAQTTDIVGAAERARGALYHTMVSFFETCDLLICPTACTLPFPVETRYPKTSGSHIFQNYMDWLTLPSALTVTSCPVLSLPCGLSSSGLPVGVQLVGAPRGEFNLLAAAHHAETVLSMSSRLPIDPK